LGAALGGVVPVEALANFAGFHANRGVIGRIVGCRTSVNVDADGSLLEGVAMAGERVLDHVLEEVLAAVAGTKFLTVQNSLEFLADLSRRGGKGVAGSGVRDGWLRGMLLSHVRPYENAGIE
jgi:hypothetical protein